jgi:hypothetical protein
MWQMGFGMLVGCTAEAIACCFNSGQIAQSSLIVPVHVVFVGSHYGLGWWWSSSCAGWVAAVQQQQLVW